MLFLRRRKHIELPKPPPDALNKVAIDTIDMLIRSTKDTKRKVQAVTEAAEMMLPAE